MTELIATLVLVAILFALEVFVIHNARETNRELETIRLEVGRPEGVPQRPEGVPSPTPGSSGQIRKD